MAPHGLLEGHAKLRLSVGSCCAAAMLVSIFYGLYFGLHYTQHHVLDKPYLMILYPPAAMSTIGLMLPLLMYISYQDEFKGLNPILPHHFVRIAMRCYSAMGKNNMKVAEKDL